MAHDPIAESVHNLSQEIEAAKLALPPKDFRVYVEDARRMHEYEPSPRGKFRGSHLAFVVGFEIKDDILTVVEKEF